MSNKKQTFIWLLVVFLCSVFSTTASAQDNQKINVLPKFHKLLRQSAQIVQEQDSLTAQDKFVDLYKKLQAYVGLLGKARNTNLTLPVASSGLSLQMTESLDSRSVSNALLISKGGKISRIDSSVVLLDGSADISYANNSIILVTGGVKISHGSNNVILAGQFVHISHDGSQMRSRQKAASDSILRSVVISGYRVDISHATNTVISAPGTVNIGHATGIALINCPKQEISHRNDVTELKSGSLAYPISESVSPISDDWNFSFAFEDFILFRNTDETWGRLELPEKR